jgi:hypothetical protein
MNEFELSEFRHDLAHLELERIAQSNRWEHRVMWLCIVIMALATIARAAGIL